MLRIMKIAPQQVPGTSLASKYHENGLWKNNFITKELRLTFTPRKRQKDPRPWSSSTSLVKEGIVPLVAD